MKRYRIVSLSILLWMSITLSVFGSTVSAADKVSGISVSPPVQQIDLTADQIQQTVVLSYTNSTDAPVELQLQIVDFGTLDETGGVAIAGASESSLQKKYGLAKWMTPNVPSITIDAHQTEPVTVTIANQDDLTPGGHYGAVLATIASQANTSSGDQVSVNQSLSSLLFVKKMGGEVTSLQLDKIEQQRNALGQLTKAQVRLHNAGNVHVVPRGSLALLDPLGHQIGQGILNRTSGTQLPETYRNYPITWQSLSRSWLPGNYTLRLQYRFDGQSNFQTSQVSYFSLGLLPFILLVGFVIAAIGWLAARKWWLR